MVNSAKLRQKCRLITYSALLTILTVYATYTLVIRGEDKETYRKFLILFFMLLIGLIESFNILSYGNHKNNISVSTRRPMDDW